MSPVYKNIWWIQRYLAMGQFNMFHCDVSLWHLFLDWSGVWPTDRLRTVRLTNHSLTNRPWSTVRWPTVLWPAVHRQNNMILRFRYGERFMSLCEFHDSVARNEIKTYNLFLAQIQFFPSKSGSELSISTWFSSTWKSNCIFHGCLRFTFRCDCVRIQI